ncbi:hypothetical protein WDW37_19115 [Bdellovibrionota bacterium FG-1]
MNGTLLKRLEPGLKATEKRRQRGLLAWSPQASDLAIYVLFRSRGFLWRGTCRLITDTAEAMAIAWIASPMLVLSSMLLSVAGALARASMDGILSTYRNARLEGRDLPPWGIAGLCMASAAVPYAAGALYLRTNWFQHPDYAFLFLTRALAFTGEIFATAWTAPITARHRVYIPGWINSLEAALACLTAAAISMIGGRTGFLAALILFMVLRLGTQAGIAWMTVRQSKSRKAKTGRRGELASGTAFTGSRDWLRWAAAASHHVPATILTALFLQEGAIRPVFALWLFKAVTWNLSMRPLRSLYIDISRALERRDESRAARLLSRTTAFGLIGIGIWTPAWILFALRTPGGFTTALILAWIGATSATRLTWTSMAPGDLDAGLRIPALLTRMAQATLMAWPWLSAALTSRFPVFSQPDPRVMGALLLEILLLVLAAMRWHSLNRTEALRATHPFGPPCGLWAPRLFHATRALMQSPEKPTSLPGSALRLRLTHRTSETTREFLERVDTILNQKAFLLALDPVHIIAWFPEVPLTSAEELHVAKENLLTALPLEVESIAIIPAENLNFQQALHPGDYHYGRDAGWRDHEGRAPTNPLLISELSRLRFDSECDWFEHLPRRRLQVASHTHLLAIVTEGSFVAASEVPIDVPPALRDSKFTEARTLPIELTEPQFNLITLRLSKSKIGRTFEKNTPVPPQDRDEAIAYCKSQKGGFRWLRPARIRALALALILFAATFSVPARAASDSWRLACDSEDSAFPLLYRSPQGKIYAIADLNFNLSPHIRTTFLCEKWLERNHFLLDTIEVEPLYSPSGPALARLTGKSRALLHRACRQSKECKLRFPYGVDLNPQAWLDAWNELWKGSPLGAEAAVCEGESWTHLPQFPAEPLKESQRPTLEDLDSVHTWFIPVTTYSDEVATLIEHSGEGLVWVSTLAMSAGEVAKLERALDRNPQARVVLLFDLSAGLHEGAIFETLALRRKQLLILPVFRSPRLLRYYHVKGAASARAGLLSFTSGNLKSYGRHALLDLGFSAHSATAARALAGSLARIAAQVCTEAPYLACTLKARFEDNDPRAAEITTSFRETCAALAKSEEATALAGQSAENSPFFTTQETDVTQTIKSLISRTTRRLDGAVHQFNASSLAEAFSHASDRKLETHLFLGSSAAMDLAGWEAHAKFLISDFSTLLWGSGNFTSNGLSKSLEIFFVTHHPQLLNAAQSYLATFYELQGAYLPPASWPVAVNPDQGQPPLEQAWALLKPSEVYRLKLKHPTTASGLHAEGPQEWATLPEHVPTLVRLPQAMLSCLSLLGQKKQRPLLYGLASVEHCL